MVLKEVVEMLKKQPEKVTELLQGRLQLAGISEVEHRALKDVLQEGDIKTKPESRLYWCP